MDEINATILPLLITKNFIVFPHGREERIDAAREFSVKAINASRDLLNSLILVVSQKNASVDIPTQKDIYEIGTLCRIVAYSDMKNFIRIRVVGSKRIKLDEVAFDQQGYFTASYTPLDDVIKHNSKVTALTKSIITSFQDNRDLWSGLPRSVVIDVTTKGVTPALLSDLLAPYLQLSNEERQEMLETIDVEARLNRIKASIEERQMERDVDAKIQNEVARSAEKAQKDYILREKLKAIKQELNEDADDGDEPDSIRKKLEDNPYPEHVKAKIKAELKRFEMMPQASLESSLILSYIQTLMNVPWYQKTEDNDDLENVKKILDEDHFGLANVKKRIVEYLAVKKMTGTLNAPILCFYGPPGCGKTSLGKSIARALDRKFFKASLGGISDEAEIRGHRRTYVGSMPGRVINGMKRVGVINPVFLLDEVDKLASSYKGDPASALLEVLDPEQNTAFNDNYLEEPYDLSKVLFIATANYLENIPAPLRDRLELIEVPSYTEIEKVEIAKSFLLKKQLKANGLEEKQVSFEVEAYRTIIQKYTREAGVRELERKIATILRKIVVEIVSDKSIEHVNVNTEAVIKYLGTPIFENTKKEKRDQVGVVTGLAYTEYGGDILPIEVNYFPGKGNLILTGKLGEVMKESATIALDYIRANAKKYKIDDEVFAKNDIHVHVPEGAVPKDGPSAGVAITTAIISCLTHTPVKNDVAMTGEVTLRGHALPIGGLREKSLAALRSGIKTIVVPRENKKHVEELPEEVKNALEIIFMDNVDDAVAVAFEQL